MDQVNSVVLTGKIESIDVVSLKSSRIAKVVIMQKAQQGQEWVDNPILIEAFGQLGEDIIANAKPGMNVKVSGTVRGRVWNDKVYTNIRAGSLEYLEEQVVEQESVDDAF
jgi:single-stranded DNA-binding protein